MILFFSYSSHDLNRLIGEVLFRERDAGGDAAVIGVGRAEADELRWLGLDPIRLGLDEPVPADIEQLTRDWLGRGGDRGPFLRVPSSAIAALSQRVAPIVPPTTGDAEILTWTLRLVARTACLVDALAPRLMVIWNGTVGVPAVAAAVGRARGLPLLFIERGPLPGLVQLDPRGFNGESSVASQQPPPSVDVSALAWAEAVAREVTRPVPADARVAALLLEKGSSPQDRIALFADQLWSDHRHVVWTEDVYGALAEAYRGSGFRLVVKRHPLDREARGRAIEARLPGSVFAEEGDICTWLKRAEHVVTIDSSVGLQAALLGRPAIVLAPASYGGPGTATKHLTRDAASAVELSAIVAHLSREPTTSSAEVASAATHFLAWWRTHEGVFGSRMAGEGARMHAVIRRHAPPPAASPSSFGASRLLQGAERRVAALEREVGRLRRRSEVLSAVEGHMAAPSLRLLGRALRVVGGVRGLRSLREVLTLAGGVAPPGSRSESDSIARRRAEWSARHQPCELRYHQGPNMRWDDGEFWAQWDEVFGRFLGLKRDAFDATDVLLDVGCGSRPVLDWFEGDPEKLFIDPLLTEFRAIERMQGHWSTKPESSLYSRAAEELVPELVGRCDFVLCWNVLDHTFDWRQILANVRDYCKRGALVCIGTDFQPHGDGHPGVDSPEEFRRFVEHHFETLEVRHGYMHREVALKLSRR